MSENRSSHESPWECHATGSNLGTDGVSGEDTPALLSSLESLAGVQTNGIKRRGGETVSVTEDAAALQLEEGRSPVEEAGHEVEEAEDEELGSTVEEGEEAALALDAPITESDLSWLLIKQASVDQSEVLHHLCQTQHDEGSNNLPEHVEASVSVPESQDPEVSGTGEWDIQCRSAQSDTCHSDNLA